MARAKIKTEMKGTGGGRWTTREDAKRSANGRRRELDKVEAAACCREPKIRGGLCLNCESWSADVSDLRQGDNEG